MRDHCPCLSPVQDWTSAVQGARCRERRRAMHRPHRYYTRVRARNRCPAAPLSGSRCARCEPATVTLPRPTAVSQPRSTSSTHSLPDRVLHICALLACHMLERPWDHAFIAPAVFHVLSEPASALALLGTHGQGKLARLPLKVVPASLMPRGFPGGSSCKRPAPLPPPPPTHPARHPTSPRSPSRPQPAHLSLLCTPHPTAEGTAEELDASKAALIVRELEVNALARSLAKVTLELESLKRVVESASVKRPPPPTLFTELSLFRGALACVASVEGARNKSVMTRTWC